MSVNARAARAISAMTAIGIPEKRVRQVLKDLVKVYDKNWELIEDENYRVLADAIFEYQDDEAEAAKKTTEVHDDSSDRPLKRLRSRYQDDHSSPSGETSKRREKLEENRLPEDCLEEQVESFKVTTRSRSAACEPSSAQVHCKDVQKDLASSHSGSSKEIAGSSALVIRERNPEHPPVSSLNKSRDKGKEPAVSSRSCHRKEAIEQPHLQLNNRVAESDSIRINGNEPISAHMIHKEKSVAVKSNSALFLKEPKVEPGIVLLPKQKSHNPQKSDALIKPKSEPVGDDFSQYELPIAIMPPPDQGHTGNEDPVRKEGCSTENDHIAPPIDLPQLLPHNENDGCSDKAVKDGSSLELTNPPETPVNIEIASSPMGEVRLSLSCNYASGRSDFHMPSLEAVLKAVEDKCLRSYKILEPNFSIMKLMQETCQCFLDLSTDSTSSRQESLIHLTHNLAFLKKANLRDALDAIGDHQGNFPPPASSLNGSLDVYPSTEVVVPGTPQSNGTAPPNHSLAVVLPQESCSDVARQMHDVNDIAKGEEKVRISFINEVSSESFPSRFFYIPRNIVYQNAYVNISLARIGNEDCCSGCSGDCLSSSIPCECARETGGEFAYTLDGLVQEKFLNECISMNRDPQDHQHYYCQDCPLERNKNTDSPGKCKGHLMRRFIKECWSKCGCTKRCGNRVVQRGITCNLQVFFTSEGKGWGLRTLEDLPRGTFVCEYVGEIVTNTELDNRNKQRKGDEEHTYPVCLDADWGSEKGLKDEEALCLDATHYGNVARFINHRCFDSNLVDIPVEVETPDHHYYHLAFFTTRKVEALEELTWDYGIDFDDHSHPVKAFHCRCGSKCCRDMKRSRRSKSKALVLK